MCAVRDAQVQAPVGFWDPVGFTKDGDVEEFTRRRGVEVKHGRIAMLATLGARAAASLQTTVAFGRVRSSVRKPTG
eukprot:11832318-Alexandrium_andersonii.AAC.1